jgi:exopolysaccharide biosynthesis polyprenyl glycosylphosphotransferase
VTTREEALVPGSASAEEEIIRLDLLDADAPAEWREAVSAPAARRRRRLMLGRVSAGQAATDAASLLLAIRIATAVAPATRPAGAAVALVAGAVVAWLAVFCANGLYRPLHLSAHDEFRRVFGATSVATLVVTAGAFAFGPSVPRAWPVLLWLVALGLELIGRGLWRVMLDGSRRRGRLRLRTLIVGTNGEAASLGTELGSEEKGYELLGHVREPGGSADGLHVVGALSDLRTVVRRLSPDCLFVASTALQGEAALLVSQVARQEGLELRYSANLPPVWTSRLGLEEYGSSVALTVSSYGLTGARAMAKRAMDIVIAGAGLIVGAPVLVVIALAVKLTSRGPVLYRQPRVTRGGRTFVMLKFRTMRRDADSRSFDMEMDRAQPFFKLRTDPRLTAVGRFIRRTSLDELPQLFNILRGDMSLVGPRPLPAEQVAGNLDLLGPRHEVRAGLTGWWQIKGRADLTPEEAVRMDSFYIENWSPSLDLYIVLKTVGVVLSRRGAY